jgi:hypothetical protein
MQTDTASGQLHGGARFLTAKNFLRVGFPGYPELQSFSERASFCAVHSQNFRDLM